MTRDDSVPASLTSLHSGPNSGPFTQEKPCLSARDC
jgi:hypothetical protein